MNKCHVEVDYVCKRNDIYDENNKRISSLRSEPQAQKIVDAHNECVDIIENPLLEKMESLSDEDLVVYLKAIKSLAKDMGVNIFDII